MLMPDFIGVTQGGCFAHNPVICEFLRLWSATPGLVLVAAFGADRVLDSVDGTSSALLFNSTGRLLCGHRLRGWRERFLNVVSFSFFYS